MILILPITIELVFFFSRWLTYTYRDRQSRILLYLDFELKIKPSLQSFFPVVYKTLIPKYFFLIIQVFASETLKILVSGHAL